MKCSREGGANAFDDHIKLDPMRLDCGYMAVNNDYTFSTMKEI